MCPQLILESWHWFVFGFILIALEILVPKVFLMWIGMSSLIVGGVYHFQPEIPISNLILLFFLLSLGLSGVAAQFGYISKLRRRRHEEPIIADSTLSSFGFDTVPGKNGGSLVKASSKGKKVIAKSKALPAKPTASKKKNASKKGTPKGKKPKK